MPDIFISEVYYSLLIFSVLIIIIRLLLNYANKKIENQFEKYRVIKNNDILDGSALIIWIIGSAGLGITLSRGKILNINLSIIYTLCFILNIIILIYSKYSHKKLRESLMSQNKFRNYLVDRLDINKERFSTIISFSMLINSVIIGWLLNEHYLQKNLISLLICMLIMLIAQVITCSNLESINSIIRAKNLYFLLKSNIRIKGFLLAEDNDSYCILHAREIKNDKQLVYVLKHRVECIVFEKNDKV